MLMEVKADGGQCLLALLPARNKGSVYRCRERGQVREKKSVQGDSKGCWCNSAEG